MVQIDGAAGPATVVECQGKPGIAYALQCASDVQFSQNLATILATNAPADGLFRWTNTMSADKEFYRLLRITAP